MTRNHGLWAASSHGRTLVFISSLVYYVVGEVLTIDSQNKRHLFLSREIKPDKNIIDFDAFAFALLLFKLFKRALF